MVLLLLTSASQVNAKTHAHAIITLWPMDKPIPAFNLKDLQGHQQKLADLRGKVVLLNFWASWCEPCLAEMPALHELSRRYPSTQLAVLAINYQESATHIRKYMQKHNITLPVQLDEDGTVTKAWTQRLFPTTVLIDSSGSPRLVVTGEYDWTSTDAANMIKTLRHTATPTKP